MTVNRNWNNAKISKQRAKFMQAQSYREAATHERGEELNKLNTKFSPRKPLIPNRPQHRDDDLTPTERQRVKDILAQYPMQRDF